MIVARANCEPLDKRLHICHFFNRRSANIFERNVLLSFFLKNVLFLKVFKNLPPVKFVICCRMQIRIRVPRYARAHVLVNRLQKTKILFDHKKGEIVARVVKGVLQLTIQRSQFHVFG